MGFNFYVSPTHGQKWDLSLETVAAALRERWPEVVVQEEHSMPGRTSLHFHFEDDGRMRIGSYFTIPGETLVIDGADADALPEIVSWFLGLTPPRVSSITYTAHTREPVALPPGADESQLREIYRPLLR
jgi:hypothetical protein